MSRRKKIQLKANWYNYNWLNQKFLFDSLIRTKKYAKDKFLDVGCGDKPYKEFFSDVITEYIGVDLPQKESANRLPKRADIYHDINKGLPFNNCSFDTILCTEVLEHIHEPDKLMAEINRVLKKEGYLILSAPQVWGLHEEPHDYFRYTKYGLKYLAEKNGLEVINIEKRGGLWAMVGQRIISFIHYNYVDGRNILMKLLFKSIYIVIGQICLFLDIFYKHKSDTLGNTIVAKKIVDISQK
ncbi:MAG: class I SAM-dependent methyltransferase [Candidatus Helarchaeota archaeon]